MIRVTHTNLDRTIKRLDAIREKARKPDMSESVRGMAKVWSQNFKGSGFMVGGWLPLSKMTQQVRRERGYRPNSPILVQSGQLRKAAIDALLRMRGDLTTGGEGITVSVIHRASGVTLRAVGPKVSNQFRIRTKRGSQPPRPFWFLNPTVIRAAEEGLQKWVDKELRV